MECDYQSLTIFQIVGLRNDKRHPLEECSPLKDHIVNSINTINS